MLRTILALIFISSSVLSTGCANKTIANQAQVEQSALEQAKEFSGDSERALAEAESKYDAALKADMKFYAPLHVEQAKEALKLAQTKELNADKIISSLESGNFYSSTGVLLNKINQLLTLKNKTSPSLII